ncbi:unnamed protein product [Bursaphelenchus xylophilus]|uniref:(pine wood nematode) hypothetical protein n=1 Tax=Bursaphelenchus xylophilus TaxID=6326 RepID=A0A1I7S0G1_BURXY|nr:unnamed protein product [Bursaphelenchus xylophilus]CAG9132242.1 unnamed protein product [Bursaphelenchus xylophilus]
MSSHYKSDGSRGSPLILCSHSRQRPFLGTFSPTKCKRPTDSTETAHLLPHHRRLRFLKSLERNYGVSAPPIGHKAGWSCI